MIKKFVLCAAVGLFLSNCVFAGDCEISRDSVRFYKQLSDQNSSDVCILYNLANEYYIRNKFQKALNVYNDIIEINPKEEKAYKKRARIYAQFNDNDHANREYARLLKNIPDSISGNYHMADIYNNISDYENALKYINKSIALSDKRDSATIWLFNKRADILKNMGRYEDAIKDYTVYATSDDSMSHSAYWNIMECYEAMGDKEKAKEAERKWQSGLYRNKYKRPLVRKLKWNFKHFKNKFYDDTLY